MNLEELEQLRFTEATTVTVRGREWRIGRLSAADAYGLLAEAGPEADAESKVGISFYCRLLSKCVLNGTGLGLDSDEARAKLAQLLTWKELTTLGQAALEFNGLVDDAKKNDG